MILLIPLLSSSYTLSTLATPVIAGRRRRIRNFVISLCVGREEGIPKGVFSRKPQVLNSLLEDYCRISTEPGLTEKYGFQHIQASFISHGKQDGHWDFLPPPFSSLSLSFFRGVWREVRRGGGQCSVFPSEIRS